MMNEWFERLYNTGRITGSDRLELYRMARVAKFAGHRTAAFGYQQWTCRDADGAVLWERTAGNLWTTQGATWLLGNALTGGSCNSNISRDNFRGNGTRVCHRRHGGFARGLDRGSFG